MQNVIVGTKRMYVHQHINAEGRYQTFCSIYNYFILPVCGPLETLMAHFLRREESDLREQEATLHLHLGLSVLKLAML